MTAGDLLKLIRKRHDGPAWIVIPEVANGTGSNVSRHADAIALNVWPSHGHEIHGYETKISREDVKKELRDPSKADSVGKYCDYWWLVVSDLAIIDGLVIPDAWGILAPKANILRIHRKAPKREAKEVTRSFAAAIIRKVVKEWVPRDEHNEFRATAKEELRKEIENERGMKKTTAEHEVERYQAAIAAFKTATGLDLLDGNPWVHDWRFKELGAVVKEVLDVRANNGHRMHHMDAADIIRGSLNTLDREINQHERAIAEARTHQKQIRATLAELEASTEAP